jgi:hypothetical protein
MKPTLKASGTQRLKLKYDEQLSTFAFKFNLRRCAVALFLSQKKQSEATGGCDRGGFGFGQRLAGGFSRTSTPPTLNLFLLLRATV